jgi:hypothetical protein
VSDTRKRACERLHDAIVAIEDTSSSEEMLEAAVDAIADHVVASIEPPPLPHNDRARIKAHLVLEALGLTERLRGMTDHEADRKVFDFIDRAVLAYADPERRR